MTDINFCEREDELLDALGRGFVTPELTAHVNECHPCAELHLVAGALLEDRLHSTASSSVPSSGTMWWRMQLRRRQEAQGAAQRSLLVGQAVTLSVAIALLVGLFGADVADGVRDVISTIRLSTPLLLAVASWLLLAPIAGWVVIRQK